MMAEKDIPKYAKGYRFHPFDQELISCYLKPKIMRTKLPCNMIKEKEVYGSSSNPWCVFDINDRDSWFRCPGLKKTEKCMFVFAKLCKISRSNSSSWKNTWKRAGCGTWVAKGKTDQIVDFEGNVIGEKRYLVFEINDIGSAEAGLDLSKIGQYKMHEYSLSGDNASLNSAGSMVLCRITYDSSKECPVNLKPGTKSANHVSSSSEAQNKEENNTNNFEGAGIVTVENLTPLYSGVSVDEYLEQSRTSTAKDLAVVDSGVGGNLEGSRTLTSESLVAIKSEVSDPFAAAQYNNGLQEFNNFVGNFGDLGGLDFCLDGLDSVDGNLEQSRTLTAKDLAVIDNDVGGNHEGSRTLTSESLVVIKSDVNEPFAAAQYNNGLQELNNFVEGFGFGDLGGLDFCLDGLDSVEENLKQSRTSTSQDLAVIDNGVGGNHEGSRTLTSESLAVIKSDVSEPFDAAQYNNGLQELNYFVEGFGFGDLGGLDFCLDGLDSVDENLEQSRTLTSKDLAVIDNGVGGNHEGSRTLTSESLAVIKSDVSEPFAAAQYNNGLQELNNFVEGFGFGDLGGLDFCLDGLDDCDRKWFMACLDPNIQEEPSRDSSSRKLNREFDYEENLYQSKKMRLANPN